MVMNRTNRIVDVVIGAVIDDCQHVLIAKRQPGQHLAGLWEFPGGKVESGETLEQALARELNEELAIKVISPVPLCEIEHKYTEKTVCLHVFRILEFKGQAESKEGQTFQWVPISELRNFEFPEANTAIIDLLMGI